MTTAIADALARATANLAALQDKLERAERREERSRADSLERASEARKLTERENLMAVQATAREYQSRCDDALQPWGVRAPAPVMGQPLHEYRQNLAIMAKKLLPEDHALRKITVRQLPSAALGPFEDQIYSECRAAALRPDSAPPGELRRVEKTDANGLKIIEWIGSHNFVRDFTTPGRRVRIRPWTDFGQVQSAARY